MKKSILTVLLFSPAVLLAQQGNYSVTGTVGKLNGPARAYLSYRTESGSVIDSANIQQGSFSFKGTITNPIKASLIIAHDGESLRKLRDPDILSLYLELTTITINGKDSVYNASVSGSSLNKDNQELTQVLSPYTAQLKAAAKAFRALTKEQRTDEAEANYDKQTDAVEESQKGVLETFITAHPSSIVSLDALKTYGGYFPEASIVEPLYAGLSNDVKASVAGQQYAKWLDGWKRTALGATAPLFAQNDKDGKPVTLESFKGKYVLVDFWASWCGPCRRENPHIVEAFNQFKEKNFTILGVSLDSKQDAWLKAVQDDKLDWTQVSDLKYWKNSVAELYGVRAIPQNFLLDPHGKIIAKNLTGDQLASKLAIIFGPAGSTEGARAGSD